MFSADTPTPYATTESGHSAGTVSRRGFLTGVGATAAGAALAACTRENTTSPGEEEAVVDKARYGDVGKAVIAFDGAHQAGVVEPGQTVCNLVAFTVRKGVDRGGVRRLMRLWTEDSRRLTKGIPPLGDLEEEMAFAPASLTITCGFGARLFDIIGKKDAKPDWLGPLPQFSRDELDEKWGEADVVLQICCDDPITLSHATRHLIRASVDYVDVRWFQHGFQNAGGFIPKGETPRNLFGVKDGTVNPVTDEDYDNIVWIDDGPDWMHGGTCLVVRRIRMFLDGWEKLDRTSREVVFGRDLPVGAPLTGEKEHDDPDFLKTDHYGLPVIDPASHMARAHNPEDQPFQKIRRRAYNYDLPPVPGEEESSNAGLMFICFQKDPSDQFAKIQARLDKEDRMNEWITHIGSAVFVCPPGTDPDGKNGRDKFWGESLFKDSLS